jgi:hypothetical protein
MSGFDSADPRKSPAREGLDGERGDQERGEEREQ